MDEQTEKADIDMLEMGMMLPPEMTAEEMKQSGWLTEWCPPFCHTTTYKPQVGRFHNRTMNY